VFGSTSIAQAWTFFQVVSVAISRARTRASFSRSQAGVKTMVRRYPLEEANAALAHLHSGRLRGAAVLIP
jgi:D-arabinose 1-dehydrogenase-like Zn-dependent alcohol dehydrogenase